MSDNSLGLALRVNTLFPSMKSEKEVGEGGMKGTLTHTWQEEGISRRGTGGGELPGRS